jgi:hypothetical protein
MFINLNLIITCFCLGGIPARAIGVEFVETEQSIGPQASCDIQHIPYICGTHNLAIARVRCVATRKEANSIQDLAATHPTD